MGSDPGVGELTDTGADLVDVGLPQPGCEIVAATGEGVAIPVENHGGDMTGVSREGSQMSWLRWIRHIPEANGFITARSSETTTVRTERH